MAHEYPDIRFGHIRRFIGESEKMIPEFLQCVEAYLLGQEEEKAIGPEMLLSNPLGNSV
jgi:hypothetical protein